MSAWLKSVTGGTATMPAVRFCEGDEVEVLRACRLPQVEEAIGGGLIVKVTGTDEAPLYWVLGFLAARTARELRLVRRAR